MKAIPVLFDKDKDEITDKKDAIDEAWIAVCERFENDVHRIRDVAGRPPYTALYACYDEDNKPFYYLVEEDSQLAKLRRKVFLNKLGYKK